MLFQQAGGEISQIEDRAQRILTGKPQDLLLKFERPGGSLPSLKRIDDRDLEAFDEASIYRYELRNEKMTTLYREFIEGELLNLDANQRPMDPLILVLREDSDEARWARAALHSGQLPFLDYTDDTKRRCIPTSEKIRLCTFHSSRGIEGQRVLVFGIEHLEDLALKLKLSAVKLGYIVLSRASLDMTIVYRPSLKSPVMKFIEAACARLQPPVPA